MKMTILNAKEILHEMWMHLTKNGTDKETMQSLCIAESLLGNYDDILEAEREKIAEAVADKMNYLNTCPNERNIILGIIIGKRKTLENLCSTCNQSCPTKLEHNLKVNYETRLKTEKITMLEDLKEEIDELPMYYDPIDVSDLIQQKINAIKGNEEGEGQ